MIRSGVLPAGLFGQEEPPLAFRAGKYVYCGHWPTSQPGNGSRESPGKTTRQSGRRERGRGKEQHKRENIGRES